MLTTISPACGGGEAGDAGTDAGGPGGSGGTGDSGDVDPTSGSGESSSGSGGAEIDPRVEACLRINACDANGGAPIGMQACLAHALAVPWSWATIGPERTGLAAMDCKLAAGDCEAVRACTPALDAFAAACQAAPGTDLCQGDTWVFCDDLGAAAVATDCAAAGLACHKDIWAGCGAEPCEFGVTPASCDGDTLRECTAAGLMIAVDCPTQYNLVRVSGKDSEQVYTIAGETCGYDEQRGGLGCVGTGAACEFFSQRCDGDVLETCAGGKLARRDCTGVAPAGQGCGFIPSGQFAGAAACGRVAGDCDPGADEICADGTIAFCDLGRPVTLDCRAAGYGGCAAAPLGERSVALCTQ